MLRSGCLCTYASQIKTSFFDFQFADCSYTLQQCMTMHLCILSGSMPQTFRQSNTESKIAMLQLMVFRLTKLGSNSQQLLQLAFQSVTALLGSMNEGSHLLLVFADAVT